MSTLLYMVWRCAIIRIRLASLSDDLPIVFARAIPFERGQVEVKKLEKCGKNLRYFSGIVVSRAVMVSKRTGKS